MLYKERIKKLQNLMRKRYDGAIITPGTNFYYLTGLEPSITLERLFAMIVPVEGEPKILAPDLYKLEIEESWKHEKFFWKDTENPYRILENILENIPIETGKLLIEDSMSARFLLNIQKNVLFKFELLEDVMKEMRMIKDSEELEYIKKAGEIVDRVFYTLAEEGLKDKKEMDIAKRIEELIYEFGGDGLSFAPIVASGPNGANPHHTPGERRVKEGDLVILDYGAKYKGYCSDITRTVAIGKVSEEAKRIYSIVKNAQQSAFEAVESGVMAKEIDLAARSVISDEGYGEYFTHRTGHGLGLDVHEPPFITPINEEVLTDGMVFTIEPGIYLPGKLGVRIEDDIAIIDGKGVRLTEADRELKVID